MKTIIFFNTNKEWGGGEKWHYNTAISLVEKNYRCIFITYPSSELEKVLKNQNIPYYSLKVKNLSFLNLKLRSKLRKILSALRPDAIFMNLPSDVKLCAPIASHLKVKKIIYRRGMPHPLKKSVLNQMVYKNVTDFIANSKTVAKSLAKNLPWIAEKTHIIYNSSPVHEKAKPFTSNKITLGNLARLVEQKGQKYLIELARELKARSLSFELLIGGEGPLKSEIQNLILKYQLQDEVKLLGHVKTDQFLKKVDVFVFPSLFEGMPNALVEAFSFGIPALAFNISSMPEVITDQEDGYLITPFDTKEMADRIENYIKNPELVQSMGESAYKKVETQFNHQMIIKQIEELIHAN